jgi:hypothetical protein
MVTRFDYDMGKGAWQMQSKKRTLMAVDVKALRSALINAVLPASEAFPILDAVGIPQSSRDGFLKRRARSPRRERDEKDRP